MSGHVRALARDADAVVQPMRMGWKGGEVCGLSRRLFAIVVALAARAWICLAEPAKTFPAVSAYNEDEIPEPVADGVIDGAAGRCSR